jgi:signal transduction histidine kinase/CheY-like chemotaxis protein
VNGGEVVERRSDIVPEKTIKSINRRLYILAAVVVVAMMGTLGFTIYSHTQSAIAQEETRLRTLSTIFAANTTNTLERNREALELIAQRPGIQAMNPAKCDPILPEFRNLFPRFANLATVDLNGMAPCSGVPQPGGKPVSVAKTEWFKRGMAEKTFLAGNPFIGPITHRWVSVLVQPVWGKDEKLLGFVGLPLDLEYFDPHISDAPLPQGTRFGILAGDGTLVWRNVDPEHMIGKYVGDQPGPKQTLLVKDGVYKNVGTDGVERYYSVSPIPMVNWYAFVGVESRHVHGAVTRSVLVNSALALLSIAIIVGLLIFSIRRIAKADADLVSARNAADAANSAKSIFLANMSHELRTPLNAILGFSGLLRKDPALSKAQREDLDIINRSGEHLLSLINEVLEMAKIEAGRIQLEDAPMDLGLVVRDVADMMQARAEEKGLRLLIDQSSEFPRFIMGDEAKLRQVLINLVGNAIKFTAQGGITIRLGVGSDVRTPHLLIEVEDSGSGIKPEDQQRIFEPFVQLAQSGMQKGTGLGLTITRQFIELMGGTITLESIPDKGSLFRVELPLRLASATAIAKPPEPPGEITGLEPGQPEYRVLVVEDQVENRLLLQTLLQNAGFTVRLAENGEQAIALFQSWRPHFIWMDQRMPVMTGIEASRRIRALPGGGEVKIVGVTASAFKEQREELAKAGMDDFVRKPYRSAEIYDCMAKHLGVRYLYGNAPAADTGMQGVNLTPEMLSELPRYMRQELEEALQSLNSERIDEVIQKIGKFDAQLGQLLAQIAGNFDYPAILRALQAH